MGQSGACVSRDIIEERPRVPCRRASDPEPHLPQPRARPPSPALSAAGAGRNLPQHPRGRDVPPGDIPRVPERQLPPSRSRPRRSKMKPDVPRMVERALEAGDGILRLAPTWVPRAFLVPGRRLRLAPPDVYALGAHRGGIDERWL